VRHRLGLATTTQISVCKSPFPSAGTAVSLFRAKTAETTVAKGCRNLSLMQYYKNITTNLIFLKLNWLIKQHMHQNCNTNQWQMLQQRDADGATATSNLDKLFTANNSLVTKHLYNQLLQRTKYALSMQVKSKIFKYIYKKLSYC